jgi:pimeloyl-ACP methyl ester carboxylesterase
MKRAGTILLLSLLVSPVTAADRDAAPAADRPKTGSFHLALTDADRAPLSTGRELVRRMRWNLSGPGIAKQDYKLSDESFEVYVPAGYTGDEPYGMVVFVSPGPGGGFGFVNERWGWKEVLDQNKLIWVGPNGVGNDRPVLPRMGLPVDAAVHLQKLYKVDPKRVYVAGVSGGGRVASMLAVAYPDLFAGGLYMVGCNFYRNEPSAERRGHYERSYNPPPADVLAKARQDVRHVFLTGDGDENREQTKVYFFAFRREGFAHTWYFQVPGMGHQPPPREWFARAVAALDGQSGETGEPPDETVPSGGKNGTKVPGTERPRPARRAR